MVGVSALSSHWTLRMAIVGALSFSCLSLHAENRTSSCEARTAAARSLQLGMPYEHVKVVVDCDSVTSFVAHSRDGNIHYGYSWVGDGELVGELKLLFKDRGQYPPTLIRIEPKSPR